VARIVRIDAREESFNSNTVHHEMPFATFALTRALDHLLEPVWGSAGKGDTESG
jgi:hypothetical protein